MADPWSPECFIVSTVESESATLKTKRARVFPLKERYMTFLLHLNEDFDDDLLLDSLGTLDCLWNDTNFNKIKYSLVLRIPKNIYRICLEIETMLGNSDKKLFKMAWLHNTLSKITKCTWIWTKLFLELIINEEKTK